MFSRYTQLIFIFVVLVGADALTHRHRGAQLHGEDVRVLRGFTHASTSSFSDTNPSHLNSPLGRTLSFEADVKMDSLIWDEMEDDNIRMKSCVRPQGAHDVVVELSGQNLDPSDYVRGAAFVIDSEHWEKLCDRVPYLEGIDGEDPILFYRITNSTLLESSRTMRLHMTAIPGSLVVPSVRISFINAPLKHHTQRKFMFDDHPLYNSTFRMLHDVGLISPGDLFQPDFENPDTFAEVVILPGSNITASGFMEGSFDNFRITRLMNLEVGWKQTLKADVATRLIARSSYRATEEREVYRRLIPDAYYSRRLLFLGRITVKAFSVVDVVQEVQIESGVDAYVRATHENVQAVTASFSSRQMDAESLFPPDLASYGAFDINFDSVIEHSVALNGFFGARPGIIIEAQLGSTALTGKFSATLGLEATLQYRNPPFAPLPYSSSSRGDCGQCHALQGRASVKGKDLQYHVHENGVLTKHKVLDSRLFEAELTTVCALTQVCPA